jgi:hypothetical protein
MEMIEQENDQLDDEHFSEDENSKIINEYAKEHNL